MRRKIYFAAAAVLWLAVMSALVLRHYLPKGGGPASAQALPAALFQEQWMGIYYKGDRIGYSARKFDRTEKGYLVSEKSDMLLNVMNTSKKIQTDTSALLGRDFALDSFRLKVTADADMVISGKVEGRTLRVDIETAGGRTSREILLRERPVLNVSLIPRLLSEEIKGRKRVTVPVLDPATLTQERMDVDVLGPETLVVMGKKREAIRLKSSLKGVEVSLWLTEEGEVLREETPLGFILVKETREEALRPGESSQDLIEGAAVPFNLRAPAGLTYLKVRITGVDTGVLELDGGRQTFRGGLLKIQKEDLEQIRAGRRQPLETAGQYLSATAFIQTDAPEIMALSKKITGGELDELLKARRIQDWVFRNISKAPSVTLPSATEVLSSRRGDCNEHAALFAALSRAAGIPTRIALGLTHKEGYFYYHAWPEIYLGEWVAVDPTFGQFPADAGHIRLVTGDLDGQMQIISAMGKIKLEGIEAK